MPAKNELYQNQSAVGTTEDFSVVPTALFYIIMNMNAGVSCFALHHLPIVCRSYGADFFFAMSYEPRALGSLRTVNRLCPYGA